MTATLLMADVLPLIGLLFCAWFLSPLTRLRRADGRRLAA